MQSWLPAYSTLCALMLLSGCGKDPKQIAREFTDKGRTFVRQNKIGDATINFQRAVQADPQFGEAYLELGRLQARGRMPGEALTNLSQAAALLPDNIDARVEICNLLLPAYLADRAQPGNVERLKSLAQQLAERKPDHPEVLRIRALIASRDKDRERARDLLEKARASQPDNPEVTMALAVHHIESGRRDVGEKMAAEVIERSPTYVPAYDLLSIHYLRLKDPARAEKIMRLKVSNNPDQPAFAVELARFLWANGRRGEAKSSVDQELQKHPDQPELWRDAGDLYISAGELDAGIAVFRQAAQRMPSSELLFRKRIVAAYNGAGDSAKGLAELNGLIESHPDDTDSRAARGIALLDSRSSSNLAGAVEDLKAAIAKDPKTAVYHYHLGRALAASQQLQAARLELLESLKLNPRLTSARIAVAELALRAGNNNEALSQASEVIRFAPQERTARLVKALALSGLDRGAEARSELLQLQRDFPEDPEVMLALGAQNVLDRKFKDAEGFFNTHWRPESGDYRPLRVLVENYAARGLWDQALSRIQKEIDARPSAMELKLLLATTATRAGRTQLAIDSWMRLHQYNPAEPRVIAELGRLLVLERRYQEAFGMLQKGREANPDNPDILALVGQVQEALGNYAAAEASYRRSLQLAPQSPAVLNNLGYLLADRGSNLDEALQHAQSAAKLYPADTVMDTLGYVYLKRGNHETAADVFSKLVSKSPQNVMFRYHLGLALKARGDKAGARQHFQAALSADPAGAKASEIRSLLATL